jgi:hypothetical protein
MGEVHRAVHDGSGDIDAWIMLPDDFDESSSYPCC